MKKLYILSVVFLLAITSSSAQMYPDRHNTNWFDGWVSCTSSISPNDSRGDIHWVMYDLGYEYPLDEIQLWNCNIPDSTDMGLQNVIIDFSNDGVNWQELGSYTLTESTGSSIYQGEVIGTMDGQTARYVLINAMSNYGGTCYSFSELRIQVAEIVVPVKLISFDASCKDNNEVLLEWSTTNEINNDFYEVQKSPNVQEWITIGRVDAAISSTEVKNYQFIDKSEGNDLQYYRLLQYDLDGHKTAYNITSVTCDDFLSDVALYPNPAEDKITVKISTGEGSVLRVRLINAIL